MADTDFTMLPVQGDGTYQKIYDGAADKILLVDFLHVAHGGATTVHKDVSVCVTGNAGTPGAATLVAFKRLRTRETAQLIAGLVIPASGEVHVSVPAGVTFKLEGTLRDVV